MWLTIAATAISAASGIYNRIVQGQEQRRELKRQQSNLKESYDNAVSQNSAYYGLMRQNATNSTNRTNEYLNQKTGYIEANRDNAAKVAGQTLKDQSAINAAQIAALKVEGSQAEGSAVQQSATSGFRGTGSATNAAYNASETYRRSIGVSQAQANLQRYSSYQSAVSAYTSATQQADLYRKQVENNSAALSEQLNLYNKQEEWQKKNLDINYTQQNDELQYNINYMDSGEYWFGQILGGASDLFGAASDIYSATGGSSGSKTSSNPNAPTRDYTNDSSRTRKGSRSAR